MASTSFLLGALVVISTPATGAGDPSVVHFTAAADYGSLTQTDSVLDLINTTDPDLNMQSVICPTPRPDPNRHGVTG